MKLSEYAKKHNIQYRSAWVRWKKGKIPNAIFRDGHVWIEDISPYTMKNVVIYARVSSSENKTNLDAQAERLKLSNATVKPPPLGGGYKVALKYLT